MREIKFRCWHPRHQAMEYFGWKDPERALWVGRQYSFRDLEIMQFTFCKDKDGKDIYEGDIVKSIYPDGTENVTDVYWGEYSDDEYVTALQCWMLRGSDEWAYDGFSSWPLSDLGGMFSVGAHNLQVVGNIYENPEMIPKKGEA